MTRTITRRRFAGRLLRWHATAHRDLVVRSAADPWQVLVAEVMSQQTGIERVGPFWRRFVTRWPTPAALAVAPTADLLDAWAGLGYNRRALAIREAARAIEDAFGGVVPAEVEALERLPGLGPYTARAIAASAYGVPVAPLDVNVRRVVTRVLGPLPAAAVQPAADALVSRDRPRRWLDAVMDLSATVCRRRDPRCDACPLEDLCTTRGEGVVERRAAGAPFERTTRWLRGRVLAIARGAPAGDWAVLPGGLGSHDAEAIAAAAADLEREGFIEVGHGGIRVRP